MSKPSGTALLLRCVRLAVGICPLCWHRIGPEDGDPESGYRWCQWCGWTDRPSCGHGILEGEWCPSCPGGGV